MRFKWYRKLQLLKDHLLLVSKILKNIYYYYFFHSLRFFVVDHNFSHFISRNISLKIILAFRSLYSWNWKQTLWIKEKKRLENSIYELSNTSLKTVMVLFWRCVGDRPTYRILWALWSRAPCQSTEWCPGRPPPPPFGETKALVINHQYTPPPRRVRTWLVVHFSKLQ